MKTGSSNKPMITLIAEAAMIQTAYSVKNAINDEIMASITCRVKIQLAIHIARSHFIS